MESEKSEKEASPEALFAGEGLALSPSERVTMETNRSPQLGRGSPSRNPLVSRPAAGWADKSAGDPGMAAVCAQGAQFTAFSRSENGKFGSHSLSSLRLIFAVGNCFVVFVVGISYDGK